MPDPFARLRINLSGRSAIREQEAVNRVMVVNAI